MSSPFSPETNRRLNNMAQAVVLAPSSNNAVQMLDNSNPSASAALIASSARHQRSPQHNQLVAVAQDDSEDDDAPSNASSSSVQSEPQIEVLNSDDDQVREPDEQYEDQLIPSNTDTEFANCQICHLDFESDPNTGRFAPCCGKTMCGTCIKRLKDTKEKEGHAFNCPFCRNNTAFVSWGNRCLPTPQLEFDRLIADGEEQNAKFHATVNQVLNQLYTPIELNQVGALPKPNRKRVADRPDLNDKYKRALIAAENHINDANRYRQEGIAALEKAIQYADKAAEANARFLLYDQCAALKQSY